MIYHYEIIQKDGGKKEPFRFTLSMTVKQMQRREHKGMLNITKKDTLENPDLGPFVGSRAKRDWNGSDLKFSGNVWPLRSTALGVLPEQVKEAEKAAFDAGVPTRFDGEGRAILTSRSHRSAFVKSQGHCDFDAGYNDPAPLNR